jgi:hypothetical protein
MAQDLKRQSKLDRIRVLFMRLYCFESGEIREYLKKASSLTEEGLDALIAELEDGKKQQDAFLAKRIEEDKDYVQHLTEFVRKESGLIKQEYEKSEDCSADDLLKTL